jgi:hypothetical protein
VRSLLNRASNIRPSETIHIAFLICEHDEIDMCCRAKLKEGLVFLQVLGKEKARFKLTCNFLQVVGVIFIPCSPETQ